MGWIITFFVGAIIGIIADKGRDFFMACLIILLLVY